MQLTKVAIFVYGRVRVKNKKIARETKRINEFLTSS